MARGGRLSAGRAPAGELAAALRSFALPAAALRLLLRERRLWPLAAVPLLLSALAVAGALAAVTVWAGPLHALTTGLFPSVRADSWIDWLWVGPLGALYFVLGKLLFLLAAALAVVLAFALAGLLAAPFQDALSRRVEVLVAGRVEERAAGGLGGLLREGGRALREEARRLAFFLSLSAAIAGFGLLIPGGQLLAGPALAALSMVFFSSPSTTPATRSTGAAYASPTSGAGSPDTRVRRSASGPRRCCSVRSRG